MVTTSFEVVLTWKLEVLAILKGGTKCFHLLKRKGGRAHKTFYPALTGQEEGLIKVSDQQFCYFVAPLPIISDRSLGCGFLVDVEKMSLKLHST